MDNGKKKWTTVNVAHLDEVGLAVLWVHKRDGPVQQALVVKVHRPTRRGIKRHSPLVLCCSIGKRLVQTVVCP